jgi:hypothetical protein
MHSKTIFLSYGDLAKERVFSPRIYTVGSTLETLHIEGPKHQVNFLPPRFAAYDLHEAKLADLFQVVECVTAYVTSKFSCVYLNLSVFVNSPPPTFNFFKRVKSKTLWT